jgi:alkylated DNA nucleotide flippase Atl1
MPSISEFNKSKVISLMQTGRSYREIQEMLGIPKVPRVIGGDEGCERERESVVFS